MICPSCSTENSEDSKFCMTCGNRLIPDPTLEATPAPLAAPSPTPAPDVPASPDPVASPSVAQDPAEVEPIPPAPVAEAPIDPPVVPLEPVAPPMDDPAAPDTSASDSEGALGLQPAMQSPEEDQNPWLVADAAPVVSDPLPDVQPASEDQVAASEVIPEMPLPPPPVDVDPVVTLPAPPVDVDPAVTLPAPPVDVDPAVTLPPPPVDPPADAVVSVPTDQDVPTLPPPPMSAEPVAPHADAPAPPLASTPDSDAVVPPPIGTWSAPTVPPPVHPEVAGAPPESPVAAASAMAAPPVSSVTEPAVTSNDPDPFGLAGHLARMGDATRPHAEVPTLVAAAILDPSEHVAVVVPGLIEDLVGVAVVTDRRVLLVDGRRWNPRILEFPYQAGLTVEGWQEAETAMLTFVGDRTARISAIVDKPLAFEAAKLVRERVAAATV